MAILGVPQSGARTPSLLERIKRFFGDGGPLTPYYFILPHLILFSVFFLFPLLHGLYLSFLDYDFLRGTQKFIGLGNYRALMTDRLFWFSLKNTAIFVLESTPLLVILGLALALITNQSMPGKIPIRMSFVAPLVVSTSAVSIIWRLILLPDVGVLNYILSVFGIQGQNWLNQSGWAMFAIVVMTVWWTVGFNILLFLAGLQEIPSQLYEAAKIDGANGWDIFWRITLPLLRPTLLFVCIWQMRGSFLVFGQVFMLTQGGPFNSTRVLLYHLYETAFSFFRLGSGAAMGWVLFLIIMIFSAIQMRILEPQHLD